MEHYQTSNNNIQAEIEAAITIFRNEHESEGKQVNDISVRCHRNTYIVVATVNGKRTSKSVLKSVARVTAQVPQITEVVEEPEQEFEDPDQEFATCIGCDSIGPLGNLCFESSCEDTGNIYANDPFVPHETQ